MIDVTIDDNLVEIENKSYPIHDRYDLLAMILDLINACKYTGETVGVHVVVDKETKKWINDYA